MFTIVGNHGTENDLAELMHDFYERVCLWLGAASVQKPREPV
jgi:hypothetical protein